MILCPHCDRPVTEDELVGGICTNCGGLVSLDLCLVEVRR